MVDGEGRALRVLVVEDHLLVAAGVAMALNDAGFEAAHCGIGSPSVVLDLVESFQPNLVLLDLVFRGSAECALGLIGPIRAHGPDVVAFTGATDAALLGAALEAGVVSIIHKHVSIEELIGDVRRLVRREDVLPARKRHDYLDELHRHRAERHESLAPFALLSRREGEVLRLMMDGLAAEAIASSCFVSMATVRAQIRSVLNKLGVNSQLAAVAMAYRASWSLLPQQRSSS